MTEQLSMSLPEGHRLKEAGIAQAYENERERWRAEVLTALERYCLHTEYFAAEDFRLHYMTRGGTHPHTHHVWSGILRAGQKSGWLEPTGEYAPAKSPATHAHPVRTYRSLIYRRAA